MIKTNLADHDEKLKSYEILESENLEDLEDLVCQMIPKGYFPLGNVIKEGKKFYQSMIIKSMR